MGCVQSIAGFQVCVIMYKAHEPSGPPVDFKSLVVCWCVYIGVGIGGEDGPVLFNPSGAAYYRQSLILWRRSSLALVLSAPHVYPLAYPQQWLFEPS